MRRRPRSALLLLLLLAGAATAPPPARPPAAGTETAEREQRVADLAYRLGEAHADRRACLGAEEDVWRRAMNGLLAAEGATGPRRARLARSFNAGYAAAAAAHPACDPAAVAAETQARRDAARLADRLAR